MKKFFFTRPRCAYLETVFDERLGIEKTMEQHLPRCHRHLQTREKNEGAGSGGPALGAAAILCRRSLPLPLPSAKSKGGSPPLPPAQRTPGLGLGTAAGKPERAIPTRLGHGGTETQRRERRGGGEPGRPEAGVLTCGSRRRMPAAWMSSQPRMRKSVSLGRSSPSCMDGVGESRSSGISEWSMVSETSE